MSLNQLTQINEEISVMERFKHSYPDFPKGMLVKSESPDFILKLNTRKSIGIELTKLHGSSNIKYDSSNPFSTRVKFNRLNIELTIGAKNEKLPIYLQKKLSQIWLIITLDCSQSPYSFNLKNKIQNWSFISGYNQVFLFDLKTEKVFELKLQY